jgi:exopolysaccharide biosynthesis polyprenyl glycosylphosphotransferase
MHESTNWQITEVMVPDRSRLTGSRQAISPILAVILVVAVALRLASALYQGDAVAALPGIHDQFSYDALARRVLAGHGFSFATDWWPASRAGEPTAHWSYLYTLYLAAVYAVVGPHPLAARLIQAVVAGVVQPWLAWRIGRRVFGPTVGLAAAELTAVYAYFVYYAGALMTETFYILAILWALDLAMGMVAGCRLQVARSETGHSVAGDRFCSEVARSETGHSEGEEAQPWGRHVISETVKPWLLLGLALGVAALLRQVILLFVPFLFAWLWWKAKGTNGTEGSNGTEEPDVPSGPSAPSGSPAGGRWSLVVGLLIAVAVIAVLIAPWTVRNYRVFGRFVLLNTNAGFAFFWANHPIYGTDFVGILPAGGPSYQDLIPPAWRGLDEAALDQALLREGLRFVTEDPLRYARLSVSRVREYFKFWPSPDSGPLSNLARVLSFGVLLPFMAYGFVLTLKRWWRGRRPATAWNVPTFQRSNVSLLIVFVLTYMFIHLLSWALIRYRLPVDAVLVVFAGVGVVDLAYRVVARSETGHSNEPEGTKGPEGAKGTEGTVVSRQAQRRVLRAALVVSDGLMLMLAFSLAYWLRFQLGITMSPEIAPSPGFYSRLVATLIPLWLGLLALFGLYDFQYLLGGTAEYARAFNACTSGMMLVVVAVFFEPTFVVARGWLIAGWLLSVFLVCGARFWLRRVVYALRRWGYFLSPTAIVGTNGEALALAEQLKGWGSSGLRVVGFVDGVRSVRGGAVGDRPQRGAGEPGLPVLGVLTDVEDIVHRHGIEELVVATTALSREELLDLFEQVSALLDVKLRLSSGLFEVLTTGVQVKKVGFVPLMSLSKLRLDPIEVAMKTALDYGLTLPAVGVLLPVFAIIGLLIKLDSPGPVFHRRRVLGVGGREFDAFKFRTMFVNGDEILAQHPELMAELRASHKLKDDPRVTRVGRWLRKYSLDELPQIFNVLKGQMSLVGPRMIAPAEAENYGRLRTNLLTVKPGITGLWQVSGRSDVSYEERVRLDMHYIRNYTIWQDLQILFIQTLPVVLRGRGAY